MMGDKFQGRFRRILVDGRERLRQASRSPVVNTVPVIMVIPDRTISGSAPQPRRIDPIRTEANRTEAMTSTTSTVCKELFTVPEQVNLTKKNLEDAHLEDLIFRHFEAALDPPSSKDRSNEEHTTQPTGKEGGSMQEQPSSPKEPQFTPVKGRPGRSFPAKEDSLSPKPLNQSNPFSALDLGGGVQPQEPEDVVAPNPNTDSGNPVNLSADKHPQTNITDSQPSEKDQNNGSSSLETLDPSNLAQLGNWTEVTDSDEYMVETAVAGPRGIKGRLEADNQHTSERGNVAKRRQREREPEIREDTSRALAIISGTQQYNVTIPTRAQHAVGGDVTRSRPWRSTSTT
ncbi:hypothetical protein R1sor_015946 [Riccia sorocarpa]|uniref:Uncharacterized protein n=1 Tax=Riccia sorocarpa TaxID=122646 RepID=A0ABD3HGS3_9MARC